MGHLAGPRIPESGRLHGWRGPLLAAVCYVVVSAILERAAALGWLMPLQLATARAAAAVLSAAGAPVVTEGISLFTAVGQVNVSGICIPIAVLSLAVALFAFVTPGRTSRRAVWCALTLLAVLLLNVVRVAVITWLLATGSPSMATVHYTVAPVLLAAVVLGSWLVALWAAEDA